MQKRPGRFARGRQAQLGGHAVLLVQGQAEVEQLGVLVADQPGQGDGGAHVGQRVVRGLVRQAVGAGQVLQLETGPAIGLGGPLYALGPQGVGHAHHVQQVPAATSVLPFAGIGVDQVAPEQEAGELVVEANGVVAHAYGAGLAQRGLDLARERVFNEPMFGAVLGRDAGDQAGLGVGQHLQRWPAVDHQRFTDLVEFGVGADAGKLGRPVGPGVGAEGFVVVPEKGVRHADSWKKAGVQRAGLSS